ncbi:MAG: acetyl-CoA carboxylase biotin carboxylase subunit [Anaerostipes sp.]|nr:acetyl-CoA carboxylase biotin carboxylase subunit [Anaerostipes sp.]
MFHKILIANRGEIAVRIIRACREMDIVSVAICSEADKDALHAQLADETVCIGPAPSKDSYLDMNRVLGAAMAVGADAIHPGFGFLSENSKFVRMCEKANITFIGPSADIIDKMGNKSEARKTMMEAGVPVVPGTKDAVYHAAEGKTLADDMGYPVMIKASAGGGGKGMRICFESKDFEATFETAKLEAENAFGDGTMYIEKYVQDPRHIEFQILADKQGHTIHLGERDCSIQRRHQKLVEESPSPVITEELRKKMGAVAVKAAKAAGYYSAGTIEFLKDKDDNFYFIEMNTRIQVEHPVTEWVTGIDLIREQIRIAMGNDLTYSQDEVQVRGHAIECRINAENTERNFMPSPGVITSVHFPGGKGVRIDSAIYAGYEIPPYYDSMIAKLIVYDKNRELALRKLNNALGEVVIQGVATNVDYQYDIINHPDFVAGEFDTGFIERFQEERER